MTAIKEFETERLILRPTSLDDAPFILKLMNTPKWLQYIGDRNVKTVESAAEYIKAKALSQQEKLGFSSYVIIRKSDQVKLGSCGLYDREGLEGIDIGYAMLPEHEGKGYAFEASQRIMEAAFGNFNIKTINAITSKENMASQRLLKKLGLHLIGTTQLPNDEEEVLLFSIIKDKLL